MAVVMAIVGTGCVSSTSYVCSDGTVCPENTVCAPIPNATNPRSADVCVDPGAIVSPESRVYPNLKYVPRRRSVIMFSGAPGAGHTTSQSDTWEWANDHWDPINVTGTPPIRC